MCEGRKRWRVVNNRNFSAFREKLPVVAGADVSGDYVFADLQQPFDRQRFPFTLPAALLACAPLVTALGRAVAEAPVAAVQDDESVLAAVLRAVRAVGGAADATTDTTLLDAGVVESIAAVELLGRLREIDAAMGMWTAELLLGEGLRVRHLLVDEGDSD